MGSRRKLPSLWIVLRVDDSYSKMVCHRQLIDTSPVVRHFVTLKVLDEGVRKRPIFLSTPSICPPQKVQG